MPEEPDETTMVFQCKPTAPGAAFPPTLVMFARSLGGVRLFVRDHEGSATVLLDAAQVSALRAAFSSLALR